jgi:hypothetical protein
MPDDDFRLNRWMVYGETLILVLGVALLLLNLLAELDVI